MKLSVFINASHTRGHPVSGSPGGTGWSSHTVYNALLPLPLQAALEALVSPRRAPDVTYSGLGGTRQGLSGLGRKSEQENTLCAQNFGIMKLSSCFQRVRESLGDCGVLPGRSRPRPRAGGAEVGRAPAAACRACAPPRWQ